jgi:hypothetical protein
MNLRVSQIDLTNLSIDLNPEETKNRGGRTGARNMRRLGIAEGVIMRLGGWKTASVFRRYEHR